MPAPLHPLMVDVPALDPQAPENQLQAPANMTPGKVPIPLAELVLLDVCHRQWAAVGDLVLAGKMASSPMGTPGLILHDNNRPGRRFWAQKVP